MIDIDKMDKELTFEEGNVEYAYQDHLGYWTIGKGFLIDKRKGGKLYPEEIAFIFANRIGKIESRIESKLPWYGRLDDARKRVLLQMAYQMGVDGLLGFKNTLGMIAAGDYDKAADGMMNSLWAKQTPNRAKRLAEMMRTGVPPKVYGTA